jgi:hypothetical protein
MPAQTTIDLVEAEKPRSDPDLTAPVPRMTPHTRPARGLPVPALAMPPARSSNVYYVVTTVDGRGRLADRSPLRELCWNPGRPIEVVVFPGGLLAAAQPNGTLAVTKDGHLRLPADLRRSLRLQAGDRLLVAAEAGRGLLVAYTMPTVDALVASHWRAVTARRELP